MLPTILLSTAPLGAQTLSIARSDARAVRPAPADHFTGTARVDMLFETQTPLSASAGAVTFEPGARTAWHSHPAGQVLIVTGTVASKFVELTNAVVFDDLWRRPDLSPRDRGLVTVAALAATGDDELETYVRRGLESGLTGAQIGEAVTHLAFYAGWSKATKAMRTVARVLAK